MFRVRAPAAYADDEGGELMLCTRAKARAAGLAVEGDLAPTHLEPRLRQPAPCACRPGTCARCSGQGLRETKPGEKPSPQRDARRPDHRYLTPPPPALDMQWIERQLQNNDHDAALETALSSAAATSGQALERIRLHQLPT